MFLNTLYATTSDGSSIRDAWWRRIETKLRNFVRRYTSVPANGQPADDASKSLMHAAVLMCIKMALHFSYEPSYFHATLLYSVYHEMLSEATGVRRLLLRRVVFVMPRWYYAWPTDFTEAEWEAITSMRMALAMSAHPRLGMQSPLNVLDPGLLPCIALHWQHSSFIASEISDLDKFVARWAALYATEEFGHLRLR